MLEVSIHNHFPQRAENGLGRLLACVRVDYQFDERASVRASAWYSVRVVPCPLFVVVCGRLFLRCLASTALINPNNLAAVTAVSA